MNSLFKNVLFIGPDYVGSRGGMGAVLAVYASSIESFNFLCSYPEKSGFGNLVYFLSATFKYTWRLLTDKEIKVVHLHSAARGSFYRKSFLGLIGKTFHKKVILHFHSGSFRDYYAASNPLLRAYIRYVVRKCDQIICISDRAHSFFNEISPSDNVIALDNPVKIEEHPKNGSVQLPVRLLFLGRLNLNKGAFDLLELVRNEQDFLRGKLVLEMAGDGEVERFVALVERYGITDLIRYKGWVAGNEKLKLIKECNAIILPSYYEELPMTILEAMACGKAIIATDVGGVPKVVKTHVNGWLFKPGDMNELLCILKEIIDDPVRLSKYGINSFEMIDKYSIDAILGQLNSIYYNLLKN